MDNSFDQKVAQINEIFSSLSPEEKYHALIELGRKLPPYPISHKTPERIVKGCQSTLYLSTEAAGGKLFFSTSSDALISAGLAAILIAVYSGESPETILKRPPTFLHDLGIAASLSPNRSNGLLQIHLRMKQEALKFLVSTTT